MKRDRSIAPLLAAAVILIPAMLAGQAVPVGDAFEIAPPREAPESFRFYQTPLSAVALPEGFAVAWTYPHVEGEPVAMVDGRLLDAAGRPVRTFSGFAGGAARFPFLVPTPGGGFAGTWTEEVESGTAARVHRPLGSLAFEDRVLLGDTDGDGRDEPCIYRKGRFLCSAPGPRFRSLVSVLPSLTGNPVPLLGDVNGDSRDDPCLFASGKLVCGLFEPHSRSPRALIERSFFHQTGDVPLLGDIDAF